ncbi:MAG: hypothetical protein AB1465_06410 [Patescibacteria group bacterium]
MLKLDPQKEATHLSKVAETKGAYFMRMFDVRWNDLEPEKGKFDWTITDLGMQFANREEIYFLSIVWPYANWDQDTCHSGARYESERPGEKGGNLKVGKPCDIAAYKNFLSKAVERYDGDGIDDMLGLKYPVKYWEIMNEPEMQGGATGGMGEELKFFVGTPQEYLEILKASYETIKVADHKAKVLHAGMAGMRQSFQEFWSPIYQEAAYYFDIANMHTINTDTKRDDLYLIKFKKYLAKFSIANKPIWITETQYGELQKAPSDIREFNQLMARSTVFSLAQGADKLFYIENWLFWNGMQDLKEKGEKPEEAKKDFGPKFQKIDPDDPTQKTYLNLIDKVNSFDHPEILKEEYRENESDFDGASSLIGQYKFVKGDHVVYALWGKAEIPSEIFGRVKVTDIYGNAKEIEANDIDLTSDVIFVEKL